MKSKILKNINLNIIITLVMGIFSFLINKYFAEYMGLKNLGLMKLFTQLVAYLNLAELGLTTASTYSLYKPLIENNLKKVNVIVSTLTEFYNKIFYFILVAGFLFSFLLSSVFSEQINGKVYIYWILYVIGTATSYLGAKYTVVFTANQDFIYVRKVQGIAKIIFQSLQIILIIYTKSFYIYLFLTISENLFIFYIYRMKFKKNYSYIKTVHERDHKIFLDMKNLFWHKIGTVIVFNTDFILISKFISIAIVGVYSSYLMVIQIAITLVAIVTSVLTPVIGKYIAQNNKNNIYLYWKKLNSIYIVLAIIISICMYKLLTYFIILWLGEKFILSELTVLLITTNLFIQIIRQMTEVFKSNSGFFDDIYVPILESLINFLFSIYLVKKIGLNGVILGTIISNISIIVILKPILVFQRCFDKTFLEYFKYLQKYIFLTLIAFYTNNFFIKKLLVINEASTWLSFIKISILLGMMVTIITIIVFFLDKEIRNLFFRRK